MYHCVFLLLPAQERGRPEHCVGGGIPPRLRGEGEPAEDGKSNPSALCMCVCLSVYLCACVLFVCVCVCVKGNEGDRVQCWEQGVCWASEASGWTRRPLPDPARNTIPPRLPSGGEGRGEGLRAAGKALSMRMGGGEGECGCVLRGVSLVVESPTVKARTAPHPPPSHRPGPILLEFQLRMQSQRIATLSAHLRPAAAAAAPGSRWVGWAWCGGGWCTQGRREGVLWLSPH